MDEAHFQELMSRLGYEFSRKELLEEALRHPSYANEKPDAGPHNQRLEFLGDAVLGLVVAEELIACYPEAREGDLTRWRAALVNEPSLAETAKAVDLGGALVLGRGEEAQGGRDRPSLLADGLEAVVGAAFLDGGLPAARTVVTSLLGDRIRKAHLDAPRDSKSVLQELVQSEGLAELDYRVVATSGPDHDKHFEVELSLGEETIGHGAGSSKKAAEQEAAHDALGRLRQELKR